MARRPCLCRVRPRRAADTADDAAGVVAGGAARIRAELRPAVSGETVGKLRKHTHQGVRTAAAELVDLWKSVVDKSMARGEAGKQGAKAKPDSAAGQERLNKRVKKDGAATAGTLAASEAAEAPAASTLQGRCPVMDDDAFLPSASSTGGARATSSSGRPEASRASYRAQALQALRPDSLSLGKAPAPGAAAASPCSPPQPGSTVTAAADAAGALSPTVSSEGAAGAAAAGGKRTRQVLRPHPDLLRCCRRNLRHCSSAVHR